MLDSQPVSQAEMHSSSTSELYTHFLIYALLPLHQSLTGLKYIKEVQIHHLCVAFILPFYPQSRGMPRWVNAESIA